MPGPPRHRVRRVLPADHQLDLMRNSVQLILLYSSEATARTITAPLARAKIVLQVQHLAVPSAGLPYRSAFDAVFRMGKREGRWAAWKGNLTNVLRGPVNSWSSSYTFLKLQSWLNPPGSKDPRQTLLAGCLAGMTTTALEYPLQYARNLLAADLSPRGPKVYSGILDSIVRVVRGHGALSLYRGLGFGMVGSGLQTSIRLFTFDSLSRSTRLDGIQVTPPRAWEKLGIAVFASVLGQWLAYPFDTVRRLAMLSTTPGYLGLYHTPMEAARQLLAIHGVRGFYHGILPGTLRTVVAGAAHYTIYVFLADAMGDVRG